MKPINVLNQFDFSPGNLIAIFLLAFGLLPVGDVWGQPNQSTKRLVYLEISADSLSPVGTQQKWVEVLQNVGADRVVSKTGGLGTPAVEETKLAGTTLIKVQGFIVGNKLKLPGGSFGMRDTGRIRALVKSLRADGAVVALADKKAFGLTSEQLVSLHQNLAKPIEVETRGTKVGDFVSQILAANPNLNFVVDDFARAGLNGQSKISEELKGLSSGTAIAAAIRPLGLVLAPYREQGKSLELRIVDSRKAKEVWPIGWPLERPPVHVEPKLFDRIDIEIRGFPMKAAMDAIQKRADVPFLYDQNTLAREGVELSDVRVTLVRKQVSISVAVSKLLGQTRPRLFQEVRADENGKAFLWITVK